MTPQTQSPTAHGLVQTRYYSFIDGLRGLAVLMVMAVHVSQCTEPLAEEALRTLVENGVRGVQLFFILSAFTLFSTSLQRFPFETWPRRNFYLRRAFRILPLWWVSIALYSFAISRLGIVFDRTQVDLADVLLDATFLFGFTTSHMQPLTPGGWSLFIEESFYWVLPLLYTYVTDLRKAANLTVWLLLASFLWNPLSRVLLHGNPKWSTFYFYFPLSQWFIFGFGFVLYFLVKQLEEQRIPDSIMRLADALVFVALWATLLSKPFGPEFYGSSCALAFLCLSAAQRNSLWAKAVDIAVLRVFGRCSYSIYLFHALLLKLSAPLHDPFLDGLGISKAHPDLRFLVWFVVMVMSSLLIGTLSFQLFEKPLVRVGRWCITWIDAGRGGVGARPAK
jgi:peptidoglycan/LPS O-acetylase OafA/YrhL